MTIEQYLDNINKRFKLGNATEHTFRGDLQQLIESLVPTIRATNEPKRQSCGAPDYILTKKDIPVGFIEAKDIGDKDLEGAKKAGNKEQFDRYKASLNNLIFTDYLDFHLYREGEFVTKIAIGEVTEKGIKPITENFERFENLMKDFCTHIGQTIKSSKKLAEMMAGKARLLSEVIEKALTSDENNSEDSTLKDQMTAFKQILIHDITPKGFADVYAQTIAYGMFAARYHDPTLPTFGRQEAYELIPKSNPFLKKLFGYIAGLDVDDRIKWIVDDLVNIFLACNVEEMLKNYGKSTKMEDPIIHFYEDFLSEYDPKLRKARGVWYTPAPVVNFIVRAVDDILKTEFDLPQGLADTSKTKIKVDVHGKKVEQEVHKVQILDPATGTGTFLAEVIKLIHKKFEGQQGIWSNYVETHLLPRLNGFELLMASYAMAHLKLDLLLTETGYKPIKDQRFRVYLTNSLEEYHQDTGTLFANWLSTEANEANHIKRDTPVMCIIGNPPYSGESANKGEWIMSLMEDYKKEPGGKEKLKERNPKWINDDYVKFLRYGQHFIEKNGSGVLAFINPHGFLDNPTFRGMRWNLLKTYDKIYTIDLHGNSKKKETAPDGSVDTNVFDIQQGVSINVFVKTGKKKANELGKILHYDLYGKRDFKYDFLGENSIRTIDFNELPNVAPMYFMVQKDFEVKASYDKGFQVNDLFLVNGVGLTTAHDEFVIQENKAELLEFYKKFQSSPRDAEFLHKEFKVRKKTGWDILQGYDNIKNETDLSKYIKPISYRPFDNRFVFYEDKLVWRTVRKVMQHFTLGKNIGLTLCKQFKTGDNYVHAFIANKVIESSYVSNRTSEITSTFPLYIYPETNGQQTIDQATERTPNLNLEIVNQIAEKLGLTFTNEPFDSAQGSDAHHTEADRMEAEHLEAERSRSFHHHTEAEHLEAERSRSFHHHTEADRTEAERSRSFPHATETDRTEADHTEAERSRSFHHHSEADRLEAERSRSFPHPTEADRMEAEHLEAERSRSFDHRTEAERSRSFAPIDILDYIYAVLHSPTYREKYKEFLKIDFPRVPYPKDKNTFWQLVKLGGEIRQIHLLESPIVEKFITQYPIDGDNVVIKPRFISTSLNDISTSLNISASLNDISASPNISSSLNDISASLNDNGKVYINDTQYFDNVPEIAWNFYIGGYQPAQKWLKDRKDRKLEFEDILHYQKIIVALTETDRLMKEIDKIEIE